MENKTEVEDELFRRTLIVARVALPAAPVGTFLISQVMGSGSLTPMQIGWALAAGVLGPCLALVAHGLLKGAVRLPRAVVRASLLLNSIASLAFVWLFDQPAISRPSLYETLIATILILFQLIASSADRIVSRLTLTFGVFTLLFGTSFFGDVSLAMRLGVVLPATLTFVVLFERLHVEQVDVFRLSCENRKLVLDLQAANDRLESEVVRDPLTGLLNRLGLSREMRSARAVGLLYVDIDRFKEVNDTRGHAAGDEVIMALSQTLRAATRDGDVAARIGGDEFVVMLNGASKHLTEEVAIRIRQQVEADLVAHQVTVSVGAIVGNLEQETADELLRRADKHLYRAKNAGGNQVSVDSRAMLDEESALVGN